MITLGFAEPTDAEFAQDPFPSKIGGQPRWLDPRHPLSADRVICDECTQPMALLLQLSAPEDEARAFHRMLYVFVCRTGACHTTSARRCMRVLRAQLPEDNAVYEEREQGDGDDVEWVVRAGVEPAPLCVICGLLGSKTCGKCRGRRYCSRSHQIADWNAGHRTQCCGDAAPAAPETAEHARRLQRMLFPEHIIVSEEEEEEGEGGSAGQDSDDDGDDDDDAGSQNGTALVPAAGERAEDSEIEVDAEFMQFQRRIQRNPDQVLRYARAPGQIASEAPLFVSASDQPDQGSDVPHCPGCGEPREFEFQVMPQLLNHLALDAADPRSIDWGTLLVYSCPRSCPPRDSEYAEETVCRQNFSAHGIGQKYMRAYYGDQTAFASQFDSLNM
ncbi:hypothetical protein LPJ63_002366 [Coemansia sp. RSA 2711]|nr:hypothetical protein LPJ63_002366 [Coemansia sp. RSA 2711]